MPETVNGIPIPVDGDPVDLPGDLAAFAEAVPDVAATAGAEAGAAAAVGYASGLDATKMTTVLDGDNAFTEGLSASFVVFRDQNGDPLPPGSLTTITVNTVTGEIDDITFEEV